MEFRKSTRDLKTQSAVKEHSSEVRGGVLAQDRDPGVGRPGAGPGRSPQARSSFVHSIFLCFVSFSFHSLSLFGLPARWTFGIFSKKRGNRNPSRANFGTCIYGRHERNFHGRHESIRSLSL